MHRAYLDGGGQDPGSAFPNKRVAGKSNAFLAKEAEENDEEPIEETSSMAAGDVQGAAMGRKNGKATSPFEKLDVEKENEDERKRSHTIKSESLIEQSEGELKTVGDLIKTIKAHSFKQKGGELGKKAARLLIGMIPGGGAGLELFDKAKDANEFFKNIYSADDSFKTNSALDNLNVDDDVSRIVDDPIEVAFLKDFIAGLKGRESEPLENLSVTKELQKFIASKFNSKTVAKASISESLTEEDELVEEIMNYLLGQSGVK